MKIGVFDSGIGGQAVAEKLASAFPDAEITVVNDAANLPYGDKAPDKIRSLTEQAILPLLGQDVIVIACNSATAVSIDHLRNKYPRQKFIGLEPMVKPAASHTKTKTIAICATPATLASQKYRLLLERYAASVKVIEPDCSTWAKMIQNNQINQQLVTATLDKIIDEQADVIVLACTHYHWIKSLIEDYVGPTILVIDPSEAISRRVATLLNYGPL